MPGSANLDEALPYFKAEVIWLVREEMARKVEDVLNENSRLFLNAHAAIVIATAVADLMASELRWDEVARTKQLVAFHDVGIHYVLQS